MKYQILKIQKANNNAIDFKDLLVSEKGWKPEYLDLYYPAFSIYDVSPEWAIYKALNDYEKESITSGDIIFCSEDEMYLIYFEGGKLKELMPIESPITITKTDKKVKPKEDESYIIIEDSDKKELVKLVNSKIKEGYVPVGGVAIEKTINIKLTIYSQALVLSSVLNNNIPNMRF